MKFLAIAAISSLAATAFGQTAVRHRPNAHCLAANEGVFACTKNGCGVVQCGLVPGTGYRWVKAESCMGFTCSLGECTTTPSEFCAAIQPGGIITS